MKKTGIFIAIMALAAIAFSTAYYATYKKTVEKDKNQPLSITQQAESGLEGITVPADTVKEELITKNTKYKLITYDSNKNAYMEEEKMLPVEWIGYTRDELINYLSSYMKELSLEEVRKGLISYDLQSFSKDRIVLIKNYDADSMPYEYYVTLFNYEVVVYYCDKKTVFEYTGIDARNLSYEDQKQLLAGIFVLDQAELYGILENYSS